MKNFLLTFLICFILCVVFMMFGGYLIFENFWVAVALVAFLISCVVSGFYAMATKVEELEQRLKRIEDKE